MEEIKWDEISKNKEIIELLKQRIKIENKITSIEKDALLKYELYMLNLN